MKNIKDVYWKVKKWNHTRRLMRKQRKHREMVLRYIQNVVPEEERAGLLEFFMQHEFYMVPYLWSQKEYHAADVYVIYDEACGLYYVDWHGKKLYWCRDTPVKRIKDYVRNLLIEQDERSPHRYVVDKHIDGAVVADVGAAEGCFSLDIIERAGHVYLFECEDNWIEALQQTFRPWKDKVTIVNKYVGDSVDEHSTTLDAFFCNQEIDYIKADIEGAEASLLRGGKKTLCNKIKTINICAYHHPNDEIELSQILTRYGFRCVPTKGYLFFDVDNGEMSGFLRRGVLYATRRCD